MKDKGRDGKQPGFGSKSYWLDSQVFLHQPVFNFLAFRIPSREASISGSE
jgi:hypothetical protein